MSASTTTFPATTREGVLGALAAAAGCAAGDILAATADGGAQEEGTTVTVQICERRKKGARRRLRAAAGVAVPSGTTARDVAALVNGGAAAGRRRRLLVVVNPVSGKKQGAALWRNRVRPILAACPHIQLTECVTSRAREATELAAGIDLAGCDGIVAVGGDGILYEIISGLLQRSDWEAAVAKLPLGIVPAGSGNGLALSILHRAGETWDVESMAYLIAKGGALPMDLLSMDSPSVEQTFSFLSTEWALASDIDITSEKYRCCGSFRFTCRALELVYCDGCVRNYSGALHYLPVVEEGEAGGESKSAAPVDVEVGAGKGDKGRSNRSDSSSESDGGGGGVGGGGGPTGAARLIDTRTLLPAITEPIGDAHRARGWKTLEGGDWKYLWAMQTTHQASDSYGAPESKLGDGIVYICIAKDMSCCVPCKMTQWLLAMEDGTHLKMKDAQMIKCRAFRLEPQNGIIAIDGERVACEPTQGEVHQGLLRVMA
jgi:sphingosine kinase